MALRVVHRTEYSYESPVSASYGQIYQLPRTADGQHVLQARVDIEPTPDSYSEFVDYFGNHAANFAVLTAHTSLSVTTTSVVDVSTRRPPDLGAEGIRWEDVLAAFATSHDAATLDARQFVLGSKAAVVTDDVREYAAVSFRTGRELLHAVQDLNTRIYDDMTYKSGITSLDTTPDELLRVRKGVCQDFAHLEIACLRSLGLAARYVSGYLETLPPPGRPKLQGADASHAWVSVFVPATGWVDVDPTNNCFVGERHVCTAWGRDYSDVSPVKGVIFTEATTNTMRVSVDVTPDS